MNIFYRKKLYFVLLACIFFHFTSSHSSNQYFSQKSDDIYNYFSGVISLNKNDSNQALKYLNKIKHLKEKHNNFNKRYIQVLIEKEKIKDAFKYLSNLSEDQLNFEEAYLLMGIKSFSDKNFKDSEKYFKKLKKHTRNDSSFNFLASNILIDWSKIMENPNNKQINNFKYLANNFKNLEFIQNSFLDCFLDNTKTANTFNNLLNYNDLDFSRYNFFLSNYFMHKNKIEKSLNAINDGVKTNPSSLLLKHTRQLLLNNKHFEFKKLFNCQNPNHIISELFYVIANLYSSDEQYNLSNFYLKISLFLNNNFYPNKILLAENYYFLNMYTESKKIYYSVENKGSIFSWFTKRKIALIISKTSKNDEGIKYLEREFKKIKEPEASNLFDLANFYKSNSKYEKSIKYYTLLLEKLPKDHSLIPKILDRRGTSYERLKLWDKAEEDLKRSLELSSEQPYVLNYLAYSWLERNINIEESYEMLLKANSLKEYDPYIMDSLGYALFLMKKYSEAEFYIKNALQILPLDPTINDHYADILWNLDKKIQARYFWKYVLTLNDLDESLKDKISNKLIFGIL